MPLWPLSSSCPLERDTYSNGLITRGVRFEEAHGAEMEAPPPIDGWRRRGCEGGIRRYVVAKAAGSGSIAGLLARRRGLRFLASPACLRGAVFCVPTILRWAKTPQNSAHMLPLSLPSSTLRLGQSTQSVPITSEPLPPPPTTTIQHL